MEELTDNAEEQEDEGSKQSEQKLGKLQYKVRKATSKRGYLLIKLYCINCSWNMILTQTVWLLVLLKPKNCLHLIWVEHQILTLRFIYFLIRRRSLKQKSIERLSIQNLMKHLCSR